MRISHAGGRKSAAASVAAAPVKTDEKPKTRPAARPVLGGGGIANVVRTHKVRLCKPPEKEAVLLAVSQQVYRTMAAVVSNLKPSKRVTENFHRRLAEIKKLRQLLLARKVDCEKARLLLINMFDHEDAAELSKQVDKCARMIKC